MMITVVIIPFSGALLTFLVLGKMKAAIGTAAAAATSLAVFLLAFIPGDATTFNHAVGGWASPLGIQLHADGLSIIFLFMTAVTGLFVTLYAGPCFSSRPENQRIDTYFWPLWMLLWGGLNALLQKACHK